MISILPVTGLAEIAAGCDLPSLLAEKVEDFLRGDILVVTQKIVSKAENRFVEMASVTPSKEATLLATEVGKDPALVELVLRESSAVVRKAPNILITKHRLGHVMANAGIDASNAGPDGAGKVLLLPENPDASAEKIASALRAKFAFDVPVIISDSFGRPWRIGTVNVAIGLANIPAISDQRGETDRDGRILQATQVAFADSVAAAAGLAMGEGAEGIPAVIVRGLNWNALPQPANATLRPENEDLFR